MKKLLTHTGEYNIIYHCGNVLFCLYQSPGAEYKMMQIETCFEDFPSVAGHLREEESEERY